MEYLIAFLDDHSRYVVHFKFLPERSAECVNQALLECLSKFKPAIMKTDNGGEFEAQFKETLRLQGIKDFKSRPGTPNDNPKIERLWKTLMNYTKAGGW